MIKGDNTGDLAAMSDLSLPEVRLQKSLAAGIVRIPGTVVLRGVTYRVTRIGEGAFAGSAASSVIIPVDVKKIEGRAFSGCKTIKTLTLKTKKLTKANRKIFTRKNCGRKVRIR